MIYLDSSAIFKLVRREAETPALQAWLAARSEVTAVSSELAGVEVIRAARRVGEVAVLQAQAVLASLDQVVLGSAVLRMAAAIGDPRLRTLDALHLASAVTVGAALDSFVAYDVRLADAAREVGLTVEVPGVD